MLSNSSAGSEEPADILADLDVSKKLKKKVLKHIKQNEMFKPVTINAEEALPAGGDGSLETENSQGSYVMLRIIFCLVH